MQIRLLKGAKLIAGLALARLFPQRADDICNNFTIPSYTEKSLKRIVDNLIRLHVVNEAKRSEEIFPGGLEALHKKFWSQTESYFHNTDDRIDIHIPAYADVIDDLLPLLAEKKIETVYELGCGNGKWLNYLAQKVPGVSRFVGIDISTRQIEEDKKALPHLSFINSELLDWVEKNATPNSLYHTCGGVLEYLSESSLRHFLRLLKLTAQNSVFLFIEPVYGDFDFKNNQTSKILGYENSYSHNYLTLLNEMDLTVIRHEERDVMGYRMVVVLACNEDKAKQQLSDIEGPSES